MYLLEFVNAWAWRRRWVESGQAEEHYRTCSVAATDVAFVAVALDVERKTLDNVPLDIRERLAGPASRKCHGYAHWDADQPFSFPEAADLLTDSDVKEAIRIWMRPAGNHKRGEPNKWVWLADWMHSLKLGRTNRLQRDWSDWSRHRAIQTF